ncbi:MAG: RNA polymerase factor sigma-54 [Verrucomicrobiales bacterium]|nr:RNA polymerase factor sigma-54 [Verrucomicrobiales bacterium]
MANTSFSQTLSQQQKLAPQMQQSLQFLQAPTQELQTLIQQELVQNPTLEVEIEELSLEDAGLENDAEQPTDDFNDEFSEIAALDDDWRDEMAYTGRNSRNHEDDEKQRFLIDSITEKTTLQEHLREQLGTSDASPELAEIAELLIGNIDDDGFLKTPIEEICLTSAIPIEILQKAKGLVQSFEPVGVGAEDLTECLLAQLAHLGKQQSLEYRIVSTHLDDFAKRRYPLIARKLGTTTEHIARAAEFIASLSPRPGSAFSDSPNHFITPDVKVYWDGLDYIIELNNTQIPQLRISNLYKDLMANGKTGNDARNYIRDKVRSGKFLIKSIHQRQQTIQNISKEIVKCQLPFFDRGKDHLKPMTMSQVAGAVGVHETTVSRAISGKYISTPHGVFELKYFFTPGYKTGDGESLSNTSVKGALAELVRAEAPSKPLSDLKIVNALKKRGIKIARRTVAKYREELNILPSHMRKGY